MASRYTLGRWLGDAATLAWVGTVTMIFPGLCEGAAAGLIFGLVYALRGPFKSYELPSVLLATLASGASAGAMFGAMVGWGVFFIAAICSFPHTGSGAVLRATKKLAVRGSALGTSVGVAMGLLLPRLPVFVSVGFGQSASGMQRLYLLDVAGGFMLGALSGALRGVWCAVSEIRAKQETKS